MKKTILLFLMTAVILAGFLSCGSSEEKSEKPGAADTVTKPADETDKPSATIPTDNTVTALRAANRTKYLATAQNIRTIANACSGYVTDNYKAPEGESINDVRNAVEPFYIRGLPLRDAWGNEFYYTQNGEDFKIASAGSDGIFDGFDQRGEYDTFEGQDIIYDSQESFVYGPNMSKQKAGGMGELLKKLN